ncbi:MAG TPA: hypothetical protein VEB42_06645, partial [Chitinophagaceae bacterium]|nr:hypothetical protein [Chitinophagaceae bacterium]
LREIKNNAQLRELPVFILYSLRKDNDAAQCRSLGVSGLYVKPGTAEELKQILREIYMICGGKFVLVKSKAIEELQRQTLQ